MWHQSKATVLRGKRNRIAGGVQYIGATYRTEVDAEVSLAGDGQRGTSGSYGHQTAFLQIQRDVGHGWLDHRGGVDIAGELDRGVGERHHVSEAGINQRRRGRAGHEQIVGSDNGSVGKVMDLHTIDEQRVRE